MFTTNVRLLREYAKNLLKMALENNHLMWYIAGISIYSVDEHGKTFEKNEYGERKDCPHIKLEAIYEYYKENPDSGIDQQVNATLGELATVAKGSDGLIHLLQWVSCLIVAEAEKRAPFPTDIWDIIARLNQNFIDNAALYEMEPYKKIDFLPRVKQLGSGYARFGYPVVPGPVKPKHM